MSNTQVTLLPLDLEREAFEAWVKSDLGSPWPVALDRADAGNYMFLPALNAWKVWQARAALAVQHQQAKKELHQLIADNAGRAAFLESHPAVTKELCDLIEENERLTAAIAAQAPTAPPLCACKDRQASECPGEWEPGCDLGNNPKHAKAAPLPLPVQAEPVQPENLPTKEHIRELAKEAADQVMEQAQVFASAWSLVGGRFDFGNALDYAEEAKSELRTLVRSLAEFESAAYLPDAQLPLPVQAEPVAYWIPSAEQFTIPKDGQRPFAKAWEPLFAQPQQPAPAAQEPLPAAPKQEQGDKP